MHRFVCQSWITVTSQLVYIRIHKHDKKNLISKLYGLNYLLHVDLTMVTCTSRCNARARLLVWYTVKTPIATGTFVRPYTSRVLSYQKKTDNNNIIYVLLFLRNTSCLGIHEADTYKYVRTRIAYVKLSLSMDW